MMIKKDATPPYKWDDCLCSGPLRVKWACEQLLERVEKSALADLNDVTKLWNCARDFFPEFVLDLMAKAPRNRGISWAELDGVVRMMAEQAESYVHIELVGAEFLQLQPQPDRLMKSAELDEESLTSRFRVWCDVADVLHEAAINLNPKYSNQAPVRDVAIIGQCELCWCWGSATPRKRFFCGKHKAVPSNTEYKLARTLRIWRPPDIDNVAQRIFVFDRLRALKNSLPSGLRLDDPSFAMLDEVSCGDRLSVEDIPEKPIPLETLWPNLQHTQEHIKGHANILDAASVVAALDPIIPEHQELHRTVQKALVRDQRLLIVMLQWAEAWLHAKAFHAACYGGDRRSNQRENDSAES